MKLLDLLEAMKRYYDVGHALFLSPISLLDYSPASVYQIISESKGFKEVEL